MSEIRQLQVDLNTGATSPAIPRQPLLTSWRAPWRGLLLEEHSGGAVEVRDAAPLHHVITLQLENGGPLELKCGGSSTRNLRLLANQVCIFPAMAPVSARTPDTGGFIAVTFEPKFLLYAAHELVNPDGFELQPRCGFDDPLLRAGILALQAEAAAGSPSGRTYAESIGTSLALHLVKHYAVSRPIARLDSGGLARHRLRRVIEYVHDHLTEDISLSVLAAVGGLSDYHFARCFKQSTGSPPHQYILRRRLELGKRLLLGSNGSVAEIAKQSGFCDQSHFASHFKKVYGMTPKAFLQDATVRRKVA